MFTFVEISSLNPTIMEFKNTSVIKSLQVLSYMFLIFVDAGSALNLSPTTLQGAANVLPAQRFKRTPLDWPSWSDVGKGFEDLGKKIHLDKVSKDVEDAVKKIDFGKVGSDLEGIGKKVLDEVKKPINSLVQKPELVRIQPENRNSGEDFCAYRAPEQMPVFSAPGLRVSEIKCAEYSWQINQLRAVKKREDDCYLQMQRQGLYYVLSGENTTPGEFPHMAAIGWKAIDGTWVFKCGGSLISPTFVLTAGHCISASTRDTSIAEAEPSIVRLGDKNIIDVVYDGVTPVNKKIVRRIPHPQYASPKKYFDAALLQLESAVQFTLQVHPACLWRAQDFAGTDSRAIVTGWGVVKSGGFVQSPELQKATIDLLETNTCAPLLRSSQNRHWAGFVEHQMCAGTLAGGADTCQGDSGGPLQRKQEEGLYFVLGVTSFGNSCGKVNQPGVYTRVSSLIDWIESVVWPA